ncbi:hypothetical protein QJR26_08435 [Clostridium baratii]
MDEEKVLLIKKRRFLNIKGNNSNFKFMSFDNSNSICLCKKYME